MSGWPTNWRQEALRAIGVPVTQHALDVLSAWFKSTPTQPWTNNPLGLAADANGAPRAMGTDYAAFPSHEHFRQALKSLAHGHADKALIHVLLDDGDVAAAWRVINSMPIPGTKTESDYPAELLDMVSDKYRDKLQTVPKSQRRSLGPGPGQASPHHPILVSARRLSDASHNAQGLEQAIRNLLKGLS